VTIWVDADAAPRAVKEILVRAAQRRRVEVVLVANRWIPKPKSAFVRTVQVGSGFDVADDYITEHCTEADLVITADIPLAAAVVAKGAVVLQPRGRFLTGENVGERLAVRDFKEELRASGVMTGGPPEFGKGDRQRFANALDRWLTAQAAQG
jgi:uncharacterized protein YaiI (UPF0178 family)